jgi:hypothetical protein
VSLIVYPDGQGPNCPEHRFYDGSVVLKFDKSSWSYHRVTDEGLKRVDGVTKVVHIIDKSEVLMRWAVKKAMEKLRALLVTRGYAAESGPAGYEWSDPSPLGLIALDELIESAKKADREELERAAETGHTAHDWIEQYIKACLEEADDRRLELLAHFPVDPRAANACIAACEWMDRHNVRWLRTERRIYSRTHNYAGTMDGLAIVDACADPKCCPTAFKDRLTLVDWKTSNFLYIEYLLQTAAYQFAYQEETGESIEDRWVIRLGKDDAEFDPWHVEGEKLFHQDFQGFLDCLALHRTVEGIRERVAAVQAARVAARRAEEKAVRDALYAIECLASKEYKGKRKKKGCNGFDKMCQTCQTKWESNGGRNGK